MTRKVRKFTITERLPIASKVVKSAVRTIQLLECFDDLQCDLTVMEISQELGIPQSSTSELLKTLVTIGYLEFERSTRTYRPTLRISLLGRWINPDFGARGPTLTLLEQLGEQTGETIVLASQNGNFSQYIHVIQSKSSPDFHMALGSVRPLVRSGTGYALLADLPEEAILRILIRSNAEKVTGEHLVSQSEFLARLAEVRTKGYAFTYDLVRRGSAIIAMALPRLAGQQQLAVGVGGSRKNLQKKQDEIIAFMKDGISDWKARH